MPDKFKKVLGGGRGGKNRGSEESQFLQRGVRGDIKEGEKRRER